MDPYLYQYLVGGAVFAVGLGYAWRQDYIGRASPLWTIVLLGGFVALATVQGYLQYGPMAEAPAVAYGGGWTRSDVLGTPLDYGIMASYFLAILAVGTWFGQRQRDTKDFFFGGQRFSWWLIAFSLVATTIGSYSFVKYSKIAWTYGLASSQTYLNDWFWLPLVIFGWLPILYFNRLTSIPEYFEHRFGPAQRRVVTGLLLLYLVGYVGINLFTMGRALNILLGWPVFWSAVVTATISAIYVTFGGQTSVIMTDLLQGVMLLATGMVLLFLGAEALGGMDQLWAHLPRGHRTAFPDFNADPAYPAVGVFWQDGMANTAMFYFLNQGILMRFMAARSVEEGRKAAVAVLAILMPIAAVVVASGGWVGKALAHAGVLPSDLEGDEVFFIAAELLARPGIFGLVMASLTAALMSTVDSLITAVAAIVVNDVVRPLRPDVDEQGLLRAARWTSIAVALIGIALVPVFSQFDSIYAAHGAFTAAVTPPMVVALLLGVFWRRYTPAAALVTLVGGTMAIAASIVWPELISPLAHGVPMVDVGEGWLSGMKQYKFMRAAFGLIVSVSLGVLVTPLTRPRSMEEVRGFVWGTVGDALRRYKGSDGSETAGPWVGTQAHLWSEAPQGPAEVPPTRISRALASQLGADVGDIIYVTDPRGWLGGLNSGHLLVAEVHEGAGSRIDIPATLFDVIVPSETNGASVQAQCLYALEKAERTSSSVSP